MEKTLLLEISHHIYIVFSLVLSILCILFAYPILTLMQVDFVIIPMTKLYLRIIFLGLSLHLCIIALQVRFVLLETASLLFIFDHQFCCQCIWRSYFCAYFHMGSEDVRFLLY